MNAHVEELAKEIRGLPEDERSFLLNQLLNSLELAEIDRAWEVELDRREADIESGRVQPVSEAKLKASLRAALRE